MASFNAFEMKIPAITPVPEVQAPVGLDTPAECTHVAKLMAVTPVGLRASGVAIATTEADEKGSNPANELLPEKILYV